MRNPILEKKIIPVTHPTDNQKSVLAKIIAAATPQLAAADISENPNLSAARDLLEKMGLITLDNDGAHVTDAGNEVMVNQNLATPDGRLTDDGQTAAYGDEEAADAAPDMGDDLELGFGDEGEDEFGDEFGDEGEDEFDFGIDNDGGGDKEDVDMFTDKKLHEPTESFSLLSDLREGIIFENLRKFIPQNLLDKLDREEVQKLMRVLTDRDDIMHHHSLYKKLYQYFVNEMPYGVAKGRTGDPADWIYNRLLHGIEYNRDQDDPRSLH